MKVGFISKVPCAHEKCPGVMDLREADADLGGNRGFRTGLAAEQAVECPSCKRQNYVVAIFKLPYIWLRATIPGRGDITTHGPATAVPCPHCNKRDNFIPLLEMYKGGRLGQIDDVVDDKLGADDVDIVMTEDLVGAQSECDAHNKLGQPVGCHQRSTIIAISRDPRIQVSTDAPKFKQPKPIQ